MPRIILQDLETEKTLSVAEADTAIGRDPAAGFVIEGPNSKVVSGRHARIFYQDNTWWLEDTSRNGTILDDERLQKGQRHAIRVGQLIGLGESGPRLRIMTLESRQIAETILEMSDVPPTMSAGSNATSAAPSAAPTVAKAALSAAPAAPAPVEERQAPRHRYEAPERREEATEPHKASPDWLVHVVLRATNTNQRFNARALVVRLGRSPDCNVQVPAEVGAAVSRIHAEIVIQEGGVSVRDAGSRNGTFVNGKRLDGPEPAAKSDVIMLGSGGPAYSIEELHIVKGDPTASPPGGVGATPSEPKASGVAQDAPSSRAPTPPKSHKLIDRAMAPARKLARKSLETVKRTPIFNDVIEDISEQSARRVRIIVWSSVAATIVIAVLLLAVTQWRVSASERRIDQERRQYEARADSVRAAAALEVARLRAAFDSARGASAPRTIVDSLRDALADAARRTGVLEQALARARQSLEQQLAAGDTVKRRTEDEIDRLRAEVSLAQTRHASRAMLDSLRRSLHDAELKAVDVASQIRAVRGVDLAQVAQMNQNAVGLVTMFADTSGAEGSGFAITPSGYFVTNRHVVTTETGRVADSVFITMADQRYVSWLRADVVALGQGDVDIAILKIRGYTGPYVKKVDWVTANVKQGEPAALIGFPRGTVVALDSSDIVRTSMSAGIFSKITANRIQFDAFSQGGSSGSPVFNASGEVVAVHFAGLTGVTGLGFAVPVSRVVALLPADARGELGIR